MRKPLPLFIVQILTIPLVIAIFKLPAEKAYLSLMANVVFWIIGLITLFYKGFNQKIIIITGAQFLLTAVIPVTILRIISWGGDFNSSSFLGIMGSQWHSYSNISYTLLLIGSLGTFLLLQVKNNKKSPLT